MDSPAVAHAEAAAAGTLVLIGGACTRDGHAIGAFLKAARARGGPIVGITEASADPRGSARLWRDDFAAAGTDGASFVDVVRGDDRLDHENAARIADAGAVFLGGGDQVKLVASLSGTKTCQAMKTLYHEGGVVCGTSAGAAALSALTLAGGEVDEEGNLVEQYIGPGFGLLGYEAIIDTHFSQRRRLQRLFLVIADNRQLFGIGLDENTALVVRGHVGEVFGAGGVTFVDGRDSVRYDNAADVEKGRHLTLSALRVGIVGTHHRLDLRERELEQLVNGTATPALRGAGRAVAS